MGDNAITSRPPAAAPVLPEPAQTGETAGKAETVVGTGCSNVKNPSLARSHAANLARADALRKACAGDGRNAAGTVQGGVSRYFQQNGGMCAEGEFQVTCNSPTK